MTKLLQVSGLTKSFGNVQAVKGLDFSINEGHCVALLGPNGAGKTTTIRMITGLLNPTAGQMNFLGVEAGGDPKRLLGYLPQMPTFYNWMSGFEFVVYAGRLCGLSSVAAKKRAKDLLERVGLADAAKRRIRGYSGGMKQRLGLAQALVHAPRLLVMDEPVSALDPLGRREVLSLLRELKEETTILFSTHVLHDAEELCDDVIIIRDGEVALQGSLAGIRSEHRKPMIELRIEADAESENWLNAFIKRLAPSAGAGMVDLTAARADSVNGAHAAAATMAGSDFFHEIEREGATVRFMVTEIEGARQFLLEELARGRVKVKRVEAGYSSLEDLFIKAVTR